MNRSPQELSGSSFCIDVTAGAAGLGKRNVDVGEEVVDLLRQLAIGQERQNELLEELVEHLAAAQRQRTAELGQWKAANPALARRCRLAAQALGQVQTEVLQQLTGEINENFEQMMDGEFVLNEFVDRYGPRLAHLGGVLQLLSQLSSVSNPTNSGT